MAESGTIEVEMPQMGESVTEGTILEWHVSEGEEVAEGDTVVEVSTDKIDAEVPAPAAGVITKILAAVDDTVAVGQVLAQIDPQVSPSASGNGAGSGDAAESASGEGEEANLVMGGGEGDADLGEDDVEAESSEPGIVATSAPRSLEDAADGAPAGAAGGSAAEEGEAGGETLVIAMPEMGESVTEGTILEWRVEEGQAVAEGDTVIEVSTDKIDAEVPAPAAGTITKLLVSPDDTVQVGQALAEMTAGGASGANGAPTAPLGSATASSTKNSPIGVGVDGLPTIAANARITRPC